jgi:6-phosphogluconate dehydrogenase (decarboxylating)
MEKIGFVGTGAMGSALLSRLKLANVQATAFDLAPAAMEAARKRRAHRLRPLPKQWRKLRQSSTSSCAPTRKFWTAPWAKMES